MYQSAQAILMISPSSHGFDEQTAHTNSFQRSTQLDSSDVVKKALAEFENFVQTLRDLDIEVVRFEDEPIPPKPNGTFVNNWLSMWPDGRVYLYPMATESRRIERNPKVLQELAERFAVGEVIDISLHEQEQKFLEGTGAMIFDHKNKLVFASLSTRCHEALFLEHARELGYRPVVFRAFDRQGAPVYHTNVVMGIQSTSAVVCSEAITDDQERQQALEALVSTGRRVVEIDQWQMENFCGNVLEVANRRGERHLVLSQTAFDNFTPEQRKLLEEDKTLVPVAIPIIEAEGGGSARCMMAEIFLSPKADKELATIGAWPAEQTKSPER